jgi:hypothetical protein
LPILSCSFVGPKRLASVPEPRGPDTAAALWGAHVHYCLWPRKAGMGGCRDIGQCERPFFLGGRGHHRLWAGGFFTLPCVSAAAQAVPLARLARCCLPCRHMRVATGEDHLHGFLLPHRCTCGLDGAEKASPSERTHASLGHACAVVAASTWSLGVLHCWDRGGLEARRSIAAGLLGPRLACPLVSSERLGWVAACTSLPAAAAP